VGSSRGVRREHAAKIPGTATDFKEGESMMIAKASADEQVTELDQVCLIMEVDQLGLIMDQLGLIMDKYAVATNILNVTYLNDALKTAG